VVVVVLVVVVVVVFVVVVRVVVVIVRRSDASCLVLRLHAIMNVLPASFGSQRALVRLICLRDGGLCSHLER
jgi:hypothetical protein